MAVKLYRCSVQWSKHRPHPAGWSRRRSSTLGSSNERVSGPVRKSKRDVMVAGTGQRNYPAIQFENGTWYREESSEMARPRLPRVGS